MAFARVEGGRAVVDFGARRLAIVRRAGEEFDLQRRSLREFDRGRTAEAGSRIRLNPL
jgi:hypothetical protein